MISSHPSSESRVLLLEGADRVLPLYPADLSAEAGKSAYQVGRADDDPGRWSAIDERGCDGSSRRSRRAYCGPDCDLRRRVCRRLRWDVYSPNEPVPCLDRAGRVMVEPDLTIPGHAEILVIAIWPISSHQTESPCPGVCSGGQCRKAGTPPI